MKKRVALLVDGNSMAWRAFHAGWRKDKPDLEFEGKPTGMIFRFLRSIKMLLEQHTDIGWCKIAWDGGKPAFRTKLLPTYKQREQRDPQMMESFIVQERELIPLTAQLGVSGFRVIGWEADDLIGLQARVHGFHQLILYSGDRDMWQLVGNPNYQRVAVAFPQHADLLTPETFVKMVGFDSYKQWFWFRVLTGDASDKIPGVPSIGEKRAREIIESGWPYTDAPPKWAGTVAANKQTIDRNMKLMDLNFSSQILEREWRERKAAVSHYVAAQDLNAAKNTFKELGMFGQLEGWSRWADAFRRLS